MSDCENDGHVWEVPQAVGLWKCTFCGVVHDPEAPAVRECTSCRGHGEVNTAAGGAAACKDCKGTGVRPV